MKQTWKTQSLPSVTSSEDADGVIMNVLGSLPHSAATATDAPVVVGPDEGLHAPVEQGVEGVDGLLAIGLVILGLAGKRQLLGREILAAELDTLGNGLAVGRVGAGQRADGARS